MNEKLILFGAGASYGSDRSNIPPLGSNLFSELSRFNPPGWGALPRKIVRVFEDDFEEGMVKMAEVNSHWMPVLQRAMAAYFFNFVPSPNNLYRQLANRIKNSNWKGACATLNYERLLELSLSNVGIRPVVGREPEEDYEIELVLPHGCCHIFCDSVRGTASGISFSGVGITTNGSVSVVAQPAQFQARINSDAFPPVMSYFEPTKRTNTGAGFIAGQRRRWSELAKMASVIAIIGIAVRSEDIHIWEPIRSSKATIVYCGGPRGAKTYRAWAEQESKISSSVVLEGYFAEELDRISNKLGLP